MQEYWIGLLFHPTPDMLRVAFKRARSSTVGMIRFGSLLEDLECYVDNSVVWSEEEGRIVGRRGGIRQWLRENAPDLSERYRMLISSCAEEGHPWGISPSKHRHH